MLALRSLASRGAAAGRRTFQQGPLPAWASVDPWAMSGASPQKGANFVDGEWTTSASTKTIPDPLNGEPMLIVPDTSSGELGPFVASMKKTPKSGLHNPLKDPGAYFALGEVNALVGAELRKPEVENFFAELLQRVVPKHDAQARRPSGPGFATAFKSPALPILQT